MCDLHIHPPTFDSSVKKKKKKRECARSDQDIHDDIHIITGVYVVDVMSLNSGGLAAVQPLRLNSVTVTVGSLSLRLWKNT